jgi:predicted nucleic acid-binding Zn ribbon protein
MIRVYVCDKCGATRDIWKQLSSNFPESLPCTCGGTAHQDHKVAPPSILFKGGGWTPSKHSTTAEVALEGDRDE